MTQNNRGQTLIDFAIAIGLFLIAVSFTISFIPGMLQPFTGSGTEDPAIADRVASSLAEGTLADPDEPYLLQKECTIAFFESRPGEDPGGDDGENLDGDGDYSGTASGCNWRDVDLNERIGVQGIDRAPKRVNITLVGDINDVDELGDGNTDGDQEILCIDANSDDRIVDAYEPRAGGNECDITGFDDDVLLALGPTPPQGSGSVTVSRRIVSLDANGVTLLVRVW